MTILFTFDIVYICTINTFELYEQVNHVLEIHTHTILTLSLFVALSPNVLTS